MGKIKTLMENENPVYPVCVANGIVLNDNTTLSDYIAKQELDKKVNGHEYVDLGLPSGLLWATCNVGAELPEEYGKYFQWGDTVGYEGDEAKAHSTWETTPFNDGLSSHNSPYFNSVRSDVCPNDVLASEYDAAHINMGGSWRMPTKDEFQELYDNTTSEWVTINGVKGRKFTASNGNYIFIPANGAFTSDDFYGANSNGRYWSSSLYPSNISSAYLLYFTSSEVNPQRTGTSRYNGFCVRGVLDK